MTRGWTAVVRRTLLAVVALVVAVGVGRLASGSAADRPALGAAAASVPAGTISLDVTAWDRIEASAQDAALRDITTRSVLDPLSDDLADAFGWRPDDLAWEAYATTRTGPVLVLGLGDVSVEQVRDGLDDTGEAAGVDRWEVTSRGGASNEFVSTFRYTRLLAGRGLLVAAPAPEAVRAVVATIEHRSRSLLDDAGLAAVVSAAPAADAATVQVGGLACQNDPLDGSDPEVADAVAPLVDPTWVMRSITDGRPRDFHVTLGFASPSIARSQLVERRRLARPGPIVGRAGERFESSLRSLRASVDESAVDLGFDLTADAEALMARGGGYAFSGCAAPEPG